MDAHREDAWRPALDTVTEALRAESFPMDKQGVAYAVGDLSVERSDGRCIPVRTVLDCIDADRFGSADEVAGALKAAVDRVQC
jgi:hypothetical protein